MPGPVAVLAGVPARRVATGVLEDLPPERDDQAGLLGDRDELARAEQPALGMIPAGQRLDAVHGAAPERHDRLVVDDDLVLLDRASEIVLDSAALDQPRPHRRVEHLDAIASVGLRAIGRRVGVAQGGVGGVARAAHDDADARGQRDASGERDRGTQRSHGLLSERRRPALAADLLVEQRELVAADARRGVAGPHELGEPVGDGDEDRVALAAAEGVVDRLEVIDVDQHHRDLPAHAAGTLERDRQAILEQRAVGKTRQRIVHGLVAQLMLGGLHPGEVARQDDECAGSRVAECGDPKLDDDGRAARAAPGARPVPGRRAGRARAAGRARPATRLRTTLRWASR